MACEGISLPRKRGLGSRRPVRCGSRKDRKGWGGRVPSARMPSARVPSARVPPPRAGLALLLFRGVCISLTASSCFIKVKTMLLNAEGGAHHASGELRDELGSLEVIIPSHLSTELVNISIDYVGRPSSRLIILTYNLHIQQNLACLLSSPPESLSGQQAHAHKHTHACAHMQTHAHKAHMHMHVQKHKHMHTCTQTHVHTNTRTCVHTNTPMHTNMCTHKHACTHVHIQTHTHVLGLAFHQGSTQCLCEWLSRALT